MLRARSKPLADRLESALAEYRSIEAAIPDPTLALAIADGTGENQAILIRGNPRNPGVPVPRRFLEVLGGAGPGDCQPREAAVSSWPGKWSIRVSTRCCLASWSTGSGSIISARDS